jgi:hypothetical protein
LYVLGRRLIARVATDLLRKRHEYDAAQARHRRRVALGFAPPEYYEEFCEPRLGGAPAVAGPTTLHCWYENYPTGRKRPARLFEGKVAKHWEIRGGCDALILDLHEFRFKHGRWQWIWPPHRHRSLPSEREWRAFARLTLRRDP